MKLCVLTSAVFVLTAAALGAWSEPVTVADSVDGWGGGPVLLACGGDSVWAVWVKRGYWSSPVQARCFAADSWHETEQVTADSCPYFWPSAIRDDSGRPFLAFYDGSYPVDDPVMHDPWAIYTTARTTSGWTPQRLAHSMSMEAFPTRIRFGWARDSSIGMVWGESFGGVGSEDSVMFSRLVLQEWTPRKCLAPGRYMDICCSDASLIPGDSTDFYVAFSRWQYPEVCTVHVWTLNDSLVSEPAKFAGSTPKLARGTAMRYLTFTRSDTLLGSANHGTGWEAPTAIATGLGPGDVSLTADAFGWAWACWTDSAGQVVLASDHAGDYWSSPETVALCQDGSNPQIASDEYGRIHCCWLAAGTGGLASIRSAYRLTRPGVEEAMSDERGTPNISPTIVRGVLLLPVSPFTIHTSLFDMTGRQVMALKPGANDVRALAPGVYFVREARTQGQAHAQVVRKIVITR